MFSYVDGLDDRVAAIARLVRIVGAVYLIYLGVQTLRHRKGEFINPGLGHVWVQFAMLGAILIVL